MFNRFFSPAVLSVVTLLCKFLSDAMPPTSPF